jgi:pyruvate kinase
MIIMRRTKLIATLGPSSNKKDIIKRMINRGADAYRLNFSHGTLKEKGYLIKTIREYSRKIDRRIPILSDLQGQVIRIRCRKPINISAGNKYRIDYKKGEIFINERSFFRNIEKDDIILIDDGKITFRVVEKNTDNIYVESLVDGKLGDRKKVIIRDKEIADVSLTQKDLGDLRFSLENDIEYIALSMVRTPEDIKLLKEYIERSGKKPWIIAKIETPSGVKNIKDICRESDGIMVARGDLGQYYPLQKIPSIQMRIVNEANRQGKITMVATQILESMIYNEQPTRAEVTDIFEAVNQHVDAILLTGETAIGKYPVEAVKWASIILEEADKRFDKEILYYKDDFEETLFDKFARGSIYMANLLDGIIIAYTKEGNTARRLSRYRPRKSIYVATHDEYIARKIALLYGVKPIHVDEGRDYKKTLHIVKDKLIKLGILKEGSIVLYTVGIRPEATDMLTIETI